MVSHRLAVLLLPALACGVSSQFPVWSQEYPTTSPAAGPMIGFDPVRQQVVALSEFSAPTRLWAWDGRNWTRSDLTNPPSGTVALFVFDLANRTGLGLWSSSGLDFSTWRLSGSVWTQLSANLPTSVRPLHLYFADSRGAVELVANGSTGIEVWHLVNGQWRQVPTAQSMPPRQRLKATFDSTRNRLVALTTSQATLQIETWEWDGTAWSQRQPSNSPSEVGNMTFDSSRGRCVMWSGSGFSWEWDGNNWLLNLAAPPNVSGNMAYDPARGRVVLVGGSTPSTWEYFVPLTARHSVFGAGCAGAAGVPQLTATSGSLPWLGDTLTCTVSNLPNLPTAVPFGLLGVSRQSWLGFTLPLSLATIGAPGCNALVSIEQTFQLTNTNGSATWSVPIPWTSSLLGARFYQQALVLDPPANALGATVSNAAEAVIGDR